MKGDDIKADVQATLDDAGIQWTDVRILLWINAGIRDICAMKPKASTVAQDLQLVANVCKQSIPATAIAVLDLIANMGADGATPGRGISTIAADRLAASRPNWRTDKGAAVRHLVLDDRDGSSFYVWPAPTSALHVEALVHLQPNNVAALADALPLNDSYRNALKEYVLHEAYAMEGDSFNGELSALHYGKYAQVLGVQIQKQKKASAPANSAENVAHPSVDKNGA